MAIDSQSAVLHSMSIFEMNEQSEVWEGIHILEGNLALTLSLQYNI